MERWLPPSHMTGKMLHFDFREGGSYRMRLTFRGPEKRIGKTTEDSDHVEVRLIRLEEGKRIEQEVVIESDDPAFAGLMRMVWSLKPENVPYGIRSEGHELGLNSSLEKLAAFVEGQDVGD